VLGEKNPWRTEFPPESLSHGMGARAQQSGLGLLYLRLSSRPGHTLRPAVGGGAAVVRSLVAHSTFGAASGTTPAQVMGELFSSPADVSLPVVVSAKGCSTFGEVFSSFAACSAFGEVRSTFGEVFSSSSSSVPSVRMISGFSSPQIPKWLELLQLKQVVNGYLTCS
jgi:hypothetical protein